MFKPIPDTENYIQAISNGKLTIGIYPVIYGMRIRAGYVGAMSVEIDWCCGADDTLLRAAYSWITLILKYREDWERPFEGIPTCSRIKPLILDIEFLKQVADIVTECGSLELVDLPSISELRTRSRYVSFPFNVED